MGVVLGAVSGKFLITAAGLLIASRIDHEPADALIDPHTALSVISADFVERGHLADAQDMAQAASRHSVDIGIGAEAFAQRARLVTGGPASRGAALVLGRDMLDDQILSVDMRHQRIRLLGRGELIPLARHFSPVAVSWTRDGKLLLPISIDGRPDVAGLDLDQPDAIVIGPASHPSASLRPADIRVLVGDAGFDTASGPVHGSGVGAVSLGLRAFAGQTIIFDLLHGQLWVSNSALMSS